MNSITIAALDKKFDKDLGRRVYWNDRDVAVLTKYYGHCPVADIARELKRTVYAVQCKAAVEGLTQRER